MIRQLVVPWPERRQADALGRPFRLLAVSDDEEPALDVEANRAAIAPVDLVVGCGDLAPDYLAFVADSLRAPIAYVRGNHDHGAAWLAGAHESLPPPIGPAGVGDERAGGLALIGLGWPGIEHDRLQPREWSAWAQALRAAVRRLGRGDPVVVISHVPPAGLGDMPGSNYHRGFAGYRWLVDRLRPPLWLHGHVHPAAAEARVVEQATTRVINVTGATLLELDPAAERVRTAARRPSDGGARRAAPAAVAAVSRAGASEGRP